MKPMQVATSPNVRFQLPDLGSSSLSRGEFVASSSVAYYSPSTSAFSARLRLNSHSQLTSVKPPLSNSIDNHSHALHKAILDGRLTQLKYFLEMGLSANCVDRHMNKRSCLMLASITDQIDYGMRVARILLKYGADVNAQDGFGRTVLYYACTMNRTKLFEYLMNEENCVCVDMRQKDNDGNSLLNHVCAHGTPRMVELVGKCMAARGVECDQRNNLGYTALLLSIKHDRLQNALTLMKSCPNVSVTIRDWEKSMNAIEWLEYKINAYKGKSMESESDLLFRYCSNNNNNNEDSNEATYSISRNSARTRTTGMSTTTPMGRLSSQQSNQSINTLASSKYLGRRKMSTSSTIETTSRATSCEASKQTIQELYKAIYSRMSMSSSLPFDYVLPPSASANAKDRRAHQNHTRHQQHTQHPQVRIEIDQKIRRPTPNVAADRALALFDQEAMRQTPKLVRLRKPSIDEETQPQSSKSLVHILFEMYDGSNRMKIKQKAVKPRLMMKRTSIVNIPLREKVSRGSIVSIPQRLKISSE